MEAATIKILKQELSTRAPKELLEVCLKMAKFKKENKELLTYLLFEANDEEAYIQKIKQEVDEQFEAINKKTYYLVKKSIRKILREIKKFIRYSKKKETETELLLHFCQKLSQLSPGINKHRILRNIFEQQLRMARKAMEKLHEDLQFDYKEIFEELEGL